MAYATQADLVPDRLTQAELGQLTSDDGSDTIVSPIVTDALNLASARVDGYCAARYIIPLQPSLVVKDFTLSIAAYLLFTRRRTTKPKETIRQAYDDAIAALKDIAKGDMQLDQPANTPPQSVGAGPVSNQGCGVFDSCNLEGFVSNGRRFPWPPGTPPVGGCQ